MEIEIIPNRLYWLCDNSPPRNKQNAFYFSIDTFLVYQPFAEDFGPLNLGMTHKFCTELDRILKDPKFADNRIYHYCGRKADKKANAAFLMGAY
jgi:cell division cycle 14